VLFFLINKQFSKIGEIEFNEFCRVMGETFFKKYSEDELRVAFRQFDQDDSGYIQANELENIMQKMGRHYNKSQINAMVKSLDTSGDGKISFEEFVQLF
jgi:Ca2+-binding EF-hand superfamily protein